MKRRETELKVEPFFLPPPSADLKRAAMTLFELFSSASAKSVCSVSLFFSQKPSPK